MAEMALTVNPADTGMGHHRSDSPSLIQQASFLSADVDARPGNGGCHEGGHLSLAFALDN